MLRSLHIENMAVIKTLEFEFSSGLTVLTGETGAGKSVITDSINFLICNKVNRDLIRSGEKRAVVSAVFTDIDSKTATSLTSMGFEVFDDEIVLERILTSEGKTTCRIDGRGVSQQIMRKVGSLLISIHGQHDTLRLTDETERIRLIDTFAKNDELLEAYAEVYNDWREVNSNIASLRKDSAAISRMKDMLEFQQKEIASAKLKCGEEEELLLERTRLQSAERIKKHTDSAARTLYANEKGISASSLALHAAEVLAKIADVVPEFNDLSSRLRNCTYELDDISSELQVIVQKFEFDKDPGKRLDEIESRLALITKLKRKYGSTIEEILEFCQKAESELEKLDTSDIRMDELIAKESALRAILSEKAKHLSESRYDAALKIEKEVCETLRFLDMPKVRFTVSVTDTDSFNEFGKDKIDLLIAANAGEPMMPLEKSASGGELSRVMLALKCAVSEADSIGTLIFDEVDSGISGKTSRKVGIKLKQASASSQVLSVTHSAQIASLADWHLLVAKKEIDGRAETTLSCLDDLGRIEETARILGGINVSESQRLAAVDMINEGKTY